MFYEVKQVDNCWRVSIGRSYAEWPVGQQCQPEHVHGDDMDARTAQRAVDCWGSVAVAFVCTKVEQ